MRGQLWQITAWISLWWVENVTVWPVKAHHYRGEVLISASSTHNSTAPDATSKADRKKKIWIKRRLVRVVGRVELLMRGKKYLHHLMTRKHRREFRHIITISSLSRSLLSFNLPCSARCHCPHFFRLSASRILHLLLLLLLLLLLISLTMWAAQKTGFGTLGWSWWTWAGSLWIPDRRNKRWTLVCWRASGGKDSRQC